MTKRFLFFGLADDLCAALAAVEGRTQLAYRPTDFHDAPDIPSYAAAADLPGLGAALRGSRNSEATYLVMAAGEPGEPDQSSPAADGRRLFWVNQARNPKSVLLTPGGLHPTGAMVAGQCVTASGAAESGRLYDALRRSFARRFEKVGGYYVGPEALQAAADGARLVDDIRQVPTMDLKVPRRGDAARRGDA